MGKSYSTHFSREVKSASDGPSHRSTSASLGHVGRGSQFLLIRNITRLFPMRSLALRIFSVTQAGTAPTIARRRRLYPAWSKHASARSSGPVGSNSGVYVHAQCFYDVLDTIDNRDQVGASKK